eukprot:TRINITY_DN3707_c0_g1_i1.p2 TRINITY_DN3707_c0_g1~~TRINITY_DN3707_c0_g1_i1.p2  ORF type:complete len:123 (+),score=33.07 TRINITY_DN3707_c0_g1_i1:95-463(+)
MFYCAGFVFFFFFKQKTAYEMLRSLVGSEMCIRDRVHDKLHGAFQAMEFGSTAEIKQGASVEMGWDQELGCRDSHAISRAQPPREGHAELRAEPAVSQSERGCRGHGDCSERVHVPGRVDRV